MTTHDPQAAAREHETQFDAMRATIARLTRERDAAAKVSEEDAAEFARLRAEVSEAFGLPPTIRPAEGEIERFLHEVTRDRDRLQRELREALERQEALRVERDGWQAETLQLREQVARATAGPMLSQAPSFYTLPEVAEVLKVSVSTVRRAVKAGELDVTRVGTLGIRVSQQALDRYIEESSDAAALSHATPDANPSRPGRQSEVKATTSAPSMPPVREGGLPPRTCTGLTRAAW